MVEQTSMEGHYSLRVINGNQQKEIAWNTNLIGNIPEKNQRYEQLIRYIWDMLQKQPEVKGLPKPKCGCV